MRQTWSGYHKGIYEDAASKSLTTIPLSLSLAETQGDPFDQYYTFLLQPIKCLKINKYNLMFKWFSWKFFSGYIYFQEKLLKLNMN